MENILPLGTVVTLKNGDNSNLMIVARASVIEENDEEVYYDYGAVLVPQGMLAPEAVYFFNRENVDEILQMGFVNEDEAKFEQQYDAMLENTDFKKGSVDAEEEPEIPGDNTDSSRGPYGF